MKANKKHILFSLITILIMLLTPMVSSNVSAVACTLWIIVVIGHYGMKGGIFFTLIIGTVIIINYVKMVEFRTFLPIMGIITYFSISVGIGLPIDLLKKEQKNRAASEEQLRRITNNIQDVIIQIDCRGIIQYISPSCYKNFGQDSQFYIGKSFFSQIHPADCDVIKTKIEKAFLSKQLELVEYRFAEEYGNYLWLESLGQVAFSSKDNEGELVLNCRDITERKKTDDRIRYLSYHDTLTGLYNRAYFDEITNKLIEDKTFPLSIIIGDVNGLKLTNDVFGHYEGDKLLIKVADILRTSCSEGDIIVRWGGDEFAILLPVSNETRALEIIDKIHEQCNKSFNEPIKISIALGCAVLNIEGQELENVIREAEEKMYRHKLLESSSARSNIISSLEETLLERSYETREHTTRMKQLSIIFGRDLGLSTNELDELCLLASLHDIGKIAIKDSILGKPGKLTPEEWQEMCKHPEIGYRIAQSTKELCHIADYILNHHERWDGNGYPQGLKETAIPKLSRIIAIIDSYDAMTSVRSYKDAIDHSEAMKEIKRCAGTQFDAELAHRFTALMNNIENELDNIKVI
jgi:diguanylate cyclase (GGDEF)-like protein/PAS domain S-box-containing protein